MTSFVPFHDSSDNLIYINPEHVTAVCPSHASGTTTQIIMSNGNAHYVKESTATARAWLQFELASEKD